MRTFLGWKASFLLEGNSPPHHHKCHRSWLLRLIPVQTSTLVITNIPWPYLIMLSVFHTKGSDNWFGRDFSFCSAFFLLLWFVVFFFKDEQAKSPQGAFAVKMPGNRFHIPYISCQSIFAYYAFHSWLGTAKICFLWPFKVWLLLPIWKLNRNPSSL